MNTLLEQATPEAIITDELCRSSFGKFTEQDMARIARRIARRLSREAEAVNDARRALRDLLSEWDDWYLDGAKQDDARFYRVKDAVIAASEALATVESSPEREGGE